jgi:hypothetical protein
MRSIVGKKWRLNIAITVSATLLGISVAVVIGGMIAGDSDRAFIGVCLFITALITFLCLM